MSFITDVDILDEAKDNFLTYAEEVLTDRAIPAAEDGLLSAQRKILWTMEEYDKMTSKSKTKKCNAIVGTTLATSYFHGDAACYGVLCKMAQEFLMRYPLIQGQGSLGTQENNDMVASSRYTEAKPSIYTDLMMTDYKKNVVPTKETYNGEFQEPVVLPSLFPNALCNGRQAIGISMSHNSVPHNLTEICNAAIAYLEQGGLSIDEFMELVPGPDFPLGGIVVNAKDVRSAFETGHSSVSLKVRGDYKIKGQEIIFTTIPYRTYRNKIKEQIEKNIDLLSEVIEDFDDNSNIGQNRLIFYVKKGINPETVVNQLFELTDLQTTISYNMNFIVNGTPKLCSMLDLLKSYLTHQDNIIVKCAEFDKDKAEKRAHILRGLIAAVDKIDEVIEAIKTSENKAEAQSRLIKMLTIDEIQANAILDMKLGKLTRIDKEELINELKEKENIVAECIKIIGDKSYRDKILKEKINDLKNKYGDARRTQLLNIELPKKTAKPKEKVEIIPENCMVLLNKDNIIKRVPVGSYKVSKRRTKGEKTTDTIVKTINASTIDSLMIFTNLGKMYRITVKDIISTTAAGKGESIYKYIKAEPNEKVISVASLHEGTNAEFAVFLTKNGLIKKTALEEYTSIKRATGTAAIKLKENDSIADVTFLKDEDVVIVSNAGFAIRVETKNIKATSRNTMGQKAIKLGEGEQAVSLTPVHKETDDVLVVYEEGSATRFPLKELPKNNLNTKGVTIVKKDYHFVGMAMIEDKDNILITTGNHTVMINAADVPTTSTRAGVGVKIADSAILSASKV